MPPAYRLAPGFFSERQPQICKKVAFLTRRQATRALKNLKLSGEESMGVYKCKTCPGGVWHYGHALQTHDKRLLRAKRLARRAQE